MLGSRVGLKLQCLTPDPGQMEGFGLVHYRDTLQLWSSDLGQAALTPLCCSGWIWTAENFCCMGGGLSQLQCMGILGEEGVWI